MEPPDKSPRSKISLKRSPIQGPRSSDGRLLFVTCGVRTFAYGFLSVVLALYLAAFGLSAGAIGGVFTAALGGGAVMTILITSIADRAGRRRMLMLGAALMTLAGLAYALTSNLAVL